jgi:putative hydrolase of the HAD superfamily
MISLLAFDADDTLWHNEILFEGVQTRLRDMLATHAPRKRIDAKLYETQIGNLKHFGYGVKGFTLSMIETAIELTDGQVTAHQIGELIEWGKQLLDQPTELLPGVADTVKQLAERCELMVITKGDLFDQESKLARSGLGSLFGAVEIVSEKNRHTYERILKGRSVQPDEFMMVGNSPRSDILPVLELGGWAVHIPYASTWGHERADIAPQKRFLQLDSISQLLTHLNNWNHGGFYRD